MSKCIAIVKDSRSDGLVEEILNEYAEIEFDAGTVLSGTMNISDGDGWQTVGDGALAVYFIRYVSGNSVEIRVSANTNDHATVSTTRPAYLAYHSSTSTQVRVVGIGSSEVDYVELKTS